MTRRSTLAVILSLSAAALCVSLHPTRPARGDRDHVEYPNRCRQEFQDCMDECSEDDDPCRARCRDGLNRCVDW